MRLKMKVAFPFRHHAGLVCDEARQMLLDAGFELVCNDTGRKLTREEQKEMIKDAFGVVAGTESYDREMLEGCDNLKAVIRFGVGTDNFDLEAMKEKGIEVGVIANHNAVAEFALTLILSTLKNLPLYDSAVRRAGWDRYPMRELCGKTVGLLGFGRIGRRLAELLRGFDVKVLAYDPYMNEDAAKALNVISASFDEVLANADILSLHLPSTPATRHIMNAETFSKMKDGAYFINTARGALVDEAALVEALKSGKLSGAGLDVYETEPVVAGNPLYELTNTTLAPHVSALSYETNYNGGIISAQSIINVLNGEKPVHALFK